MPYPFSALLSRMNYIDRWGLMRNSRREALSEHTLATALASHLLANIAKGRFGADVRPEKVAVAALYHDMSEIITGDMPTPVKYGSDALRDEYKKVEREAQQKLISMLPDEIREPFAAEALEDGLNERERRILKAADKLSALQKCLEEEVSGNTEFRSAAISTREYLLKEPLPEVLFYLDNFFPGFSMTLDELMAQNAPETHLEVAKVADREEIMAIYDSLRDGVLWDEHYPNYELLDDDLAKGRLYCRREDGRIIAVISMNFGVDEDGEVPCFTPCRRPVVFHRLGVAPFAQNRGIAKQMLSELMLVAAAEGADMVRFLVAKNNPAAIKSYSVLGFSVVGETSAWGDDYYCYEKKLS